MAGKVTSRAWFGRKTFGWGLRPVSWQGWMLTAFYVLLIFLIAHAFANIMRCSLWPRWLW